MKQDVAKNKGYALQLDIRHYFPGGVPENIRYALECHQSAESWAFYAECDVALIEKTAQKLVESTGKTYRQAIDEVGWALCKEKQPKRYHATCSTLISPPKERPTMNRAQRRRANREKRKKK